MRKLWSISGRSWKVPPWDIVYKFFNKTINERVVKGLGNSVDKAQHPSYQACRKSLLSGHALQREVKSGPLVWFPFGPYLTTMPFYYFIHSS